MQSIKEKKSINPGVRSTVLRSYCKILNTIQSMQNIGQWDVGYRMVEIFGERFTEDRVMTRIEMMYAKERHNELLSLIRIKYKMLKRKRE
jgi:hypothetical protein